MKSERRSKGMLPKHQCLCRKVFDRSRSHGPLSRWSWKRGRIYFQRPRSADVRCISSRIKNRVSSSSTFISSAVYIEACQAHYRREICCRRQRGRHPGVLLRISASISRFFHVVILQFNCSELWKLFVKPARRQYNCKTGHFTSLISPSERMRNVQKRKTHGRSVFKCQICKFLTDLCWSSWLLKLLICKRLVYNAVIDVKSLVFQVCATFPLFWYSSLSCRRVPVVSGKIMFFQQLYCENDTSLLQG